MMKGVLLSMLLIPALVFSQNDSTNKGVSFITNMDWQDIMKLARETNKYIMVDCYTTWCAPCKKMEKEVFTHFRSGYAVNDKFIALRLQMDSTDYDSELVKRQYPMANSFIKDFNIDGFPTILYFTPYGKLIHKEVGFMDVPTFIRSTELARHPKKLELYKQYDNYKIGKKDYKSLAELALFTKKLLGERILAKQMAEDYKNNFLDTVSDIYKKEILDFVGYDFQDVAKISDRFFTLAYNKPQLFDSIVGHKGTAKYFVEKTIVRNEIEAPLIRKNGVARTRDWKSLEKVIAVKFPLVDSRKIVLGYKLSYYQNVHLNWRLWAQYKEEMLASYPPVPPYGLDVYIEVNGWGGAWLVFMKCNKTSVLKKAINWVDLAIKLDPDKKDEYLDTKANLLYKLGRRNQALVIQKKALELAKRKDGDIADNYTKMLRGEPTWPVN